MGKTSPFIGLLLTLLLTSGGAGLHARAFASAAAAADLVYVLDQFRLDAIATTDPTEPGTFVAALYIRGSQLLVVSARHSSVEGVAHRIATGQYREVYLDLQGTPTPQNKFFVQDARADGILSALPGSGDVDVLYEDGVRQMLFNGDTRGQHVTEAEYDSKLAAADAQYARLLTLLTSAVHQIQHPTTDSPD